MPPTYLINSTTFDLEQEQGEYAIVSHRWVKGKEIKFAKFIDKEHPDRQNQMKKLQKPDSISVIDEPGLAKIAWACRFAKDSGIPYVWIDTCCIDKSDVVATSKDINAMFRYYKEAKVCYTFLLDVDDNQEDHQTQAVKRKPVQPAGPPQFEIGSRSFKDSEWFKRGWTLQELLASKNLEFYDHKCTRRGTKETRLDEISEATRIEQGFLNGKRSIKDACIAVKMSWASGRETTMKEDMAYSLLGLFDVHMDLRYGEEENAFMRLQEQLVEKYRDESIFAWTRNGRPGVKYGLLAPWPSCFRDSASLTIDNAQYEKPRGLQGYRVVKQGIEFELPEKWPNSGNGADWNNLNANKRKSYDLGLNCWEKGGEGKGSVTILLRRNQGADWRRTSLESLHFGENLKPSSTRVMGVTISKTVPQYIPHRVSREDEDEDENEDKIEDENPARDPASRKGSRLMGRLKLPFGRA